MLRAGILRKLWSTKSFVFYIVVYYQLLFFMSKLNIASTVKRREKKPSIQHVSTLTYTHPKWQQASAKADHNLFYGHTLLKWDLRMYEDPTWIPVTRVLGLYLLLSCSSGFPLSSETAWAGSHRKLQLRSQTQWFAMDRRQRLQCSHWSSAKPGSDPTSHNSLLLLGHRYSGNLDDRTN